jgi:DNA-binding transcriptional LysR family regulator
MTPRQFDQALLVARMSRESKTAQAARLALLDGLSHNAAARQIGIDPSAVTRAVAKLQPRPCCPTCGQKMPVSG